MKFNGRKILIFIAASVLSFLLFMAVFTFALSNTVANPSYVKKLLAESKTYDNVIDQTFKLASIQKTLEINNTNNSGIEELAPVIEKTLTPQLLQKNTEAVIDGIDVWLSGKANTPQFSIAVTSLKTEMTNNVADYLYNRVQALPTCQQATTIEYDPLTATCKPNVRIDKQDFIDNAQKVINELPFMKSDTLTYETFANAENQNNTSKLPKTIPKAYQWLKIAPYIFGILALAAAFTVILLRKDHVRALKTVGHTLFIAGIFLVLAGFIAKLILNKSLGTVGQSSDAQHAFAEIIFIPLTQNLGSKLSNISLYFGVGFIFLSALCYVTAKFVFQNQQNNKKLDKSEEGKSDNEDKPVNLTEQSKDLN